MQVIRRVLDRTGGPVDRRATQAWSVLVRVRVAIMWQAVVRHHRWVGEIVPAYMLGCRVGYRILRRLKAAVVGQAIVAGRPTTAVSGGHRSQRRQRSSQPTARRTSASCLASSA